MRALRQIDPRARLADLVVLGLIAADRHFPNVEREAAADHQGAQCDVFKAKSQTDTGACIGPDELSSRPADRKRGTAGVGANATKAQKIEPKRDPLRPPSTERIV